MLFFLGGYPSCAWDGVEGLGGPALLPLWTTTFANLEPKYTSPAPERRPKPQLLSSAEVM